MADVVHQRGSVAELHALDPFGSESAVVAPQVWWCDPTDSAIVLGSRQPFELVDASAASAAGLTIARRRSGGGAVVVRPEECAWIDVILPHGLAPDDIRGAMVWIGERWVTALRSTVSPVVLSDGLEVHRGGMLATAWSELICFAGIGPGEVLLDGHKLVGLSQRRTRRGLRIQGLVYLDPATAVVADLLVGDLPDGDPAEPAVLGGLDPASLANALATGLS